MRKWQDLASRRGRIPTLVRWKTTQYGWVACGWQRILTPFKCHSDDNTHFLNCGHHLFMYTAQYTLSICAKNIYEDRCLLFMRLRSFELLPQASVSSLGLKSSPVITCIDRELAQLLKLKTLSHPFCTRRSNLTSAQTNQNGVTNQSFSFY